MENLPTLVHQTIARELAYLGSDGFCNLRACSQDWKAICNDEISSVKVDAVELKEAVPFMNMLACLTRLVVRGSNTNSSVVWGNALAKLNPKLSHLELTHACNEDEGWMKSLGDIDDDELEECRYPQMSVSNLSNLLQPVSQSLISLHLDYCYFAPSPGNKLNRPGFFSQLPNLQTLQLVCASAGKPALRTLDLAGCGELRSLDCSMCSITALDVPACTALTSLNCSVNNLAEMGLALCAGLLSLDCSHQHDIRNLDLSACTALSKLDCSSNDLRTIRFPGGVVMEPSDDEDPITYPDLGGVILPNIRCDAPMFSAWPLAMRALVEYLVLTAEVAYDLAGFENLRYLSCTMWFNALLDLTHCTEGVELELGCSDDDVEFTFLGRNVVHKLTLVKGMSLDNFSGFESLKELYLNFQKVALIDLCGCPSVRVVEVGSDLDSISLKTINLGGCSNLEDLTCSGHKQLTELDLSSCIALKRFTCEGSNLKSLDISCCLQLESLKVTTNGNTQLTIDSRGCPDRFKATMMKDPDEEPFHVPTEPFKSPHELLRRGSEPKADPTESASS